MPRRSSSSSRWLQRQARDSFVRKSRQDGYRSRAAYKLLEINERDKLMRGGSRVVDLGAAPGGWTQVAAEICGAEGTVVAIDLLKMEPLEGATLVHGDCREKKTIDNVTASLQGRPADLVMSDMAPNISGMRAVDQPRAMYLAELALDFARQHLAQGGDLLVKVFQGEGFDAFLADTRQDFSRVSVVKPKASRPRSREVYILARGVRN